MKIDSSVKHSTLEFCSKNFRLDLFNLMLKFLRQILLRKKKSNLCKICNSSIFGSEIFDRFVDQTFGSKWLVQKFFVKKKSQQKLRRFLENFDDENIVFNQVSNCFKIFFDGFEFSVSFSFSNTNCNDCVTI